MSTQAENRKEGGRDVRKTMSWKLLEVESKEDRAIGERRKRKRRLSIWYIGREDRCQGRHALLFLYFSFWEPLFARSIHHNDGNPQTHLFLLSSFPLCLFHASLRPSIFPPFCFSALSRNFKAFAQTLCIEGFPRESAYWLAITILSMQSIHLIMSSHSDYSAFLLRPNDLLTIFLRSFICCHKEFICPLLVCIDLCVSASVISPICPVRSQLT